VEFCYERKIYRFVGKESLKEASGQVRRSIDRAPGGSLTHIEEKRREVEMVEEKRIDC